MGISLAVDENEGYYIPVGHNPEMGEQLPLQTVLDALRAPFSDEHLPKIGHNMKYDLVMLRRYGVPVSPLVFDTMIAEWLIEPTSHNLGLKNLAWVRLDAKMTKAFHAVHECAQENHIDNRVAAYVVAVARVAEVVKLRGWV